MNNSEAILCIIDRFEGEYAVIEYRGKIMFNIPKVLLPEDSAEGDVITINTAIDHKETTRRRNRLEELARDIFTEE